MKQRVDIPRSWSTNNGTIKILRAILHLLHALFPTSRTPSIIRILDLAIVVPFGDLISKDNRSVHSTIPPISLSLWVIEHPLHILTCRVVTCVRGHDSKSIRSERTHRVPIDAAGETAIANGHEAVVPFVGEKETEGVGGG